MPRRYYSSIAQRTTLAADINSSTTSVTVAAVTGWPSSFPYTLIIDQDTISEEIVEVSARSGTTLTVTRGVDGTTAVAHTAGATVNHGVSARDFNEPNQFLNEGGTVAGPTLVTANSSSTAFEVRQTGAGNALVVEDSTNPDATPFVVDASGNVGIGTSSPATLLHTASNSANSLRQDRNSTDANAANLLHYKRRGTAASPTIVASGDVAGQWIAYGYDGAADVALGGINIEVDGTPGSSDMPGRMRFFTTADGAATASERMRIDSAGSVNIGDVSGVARTDLTIQRNARTVSVPTIRLIDTDSAAANNTNGALEFFAADGSTPAGSSVRVALQSVSNANGGASDFRVLTNDGTLTERMRITSAGNVGIGTTSPGQRLTVAGDAELRNDGSTQPTLHFTSQDGTTNVWQIDAQVSNSVNAQLQFINNGTERMRIMANGNVGIGTSNPESSLHVSSATSGQPQVLIENTNTDANPAYLRISKKPSDNTFAANDYVGVIRFDACDTGGTRRPAAQINIVAEGAASASGAPATYMGFQVTNASNAATERMRIDNAGLITGSGTSLGAWTAYTPTLGGTGWAIGNGGAVGYYCQIGKIVHVLANITFGSTSTFGAGIPTITLPVTAAVRDIHITGELVDASLSAIYLALWRYNTSTTLGGRYASGGASSAISATNPFTWATTDTMRFQGTYEIA